MITREEVLRLAALARINIPDAQIEKVRKDFGAILDYVEKINEAGSRSSSGVRGGGGRADGARTGDLSPDAISDLHIVRSVLREDANAHEPGIHTEELLSAVPEREGNYVKVKKILAQ